MPLFGKLSTGPSAGKGQVSFQSQRKAMPKNVQMTAQLHSSHTLTKKCLKFSKPSFSSTWTVKFQMYKLDLKRQRNQRSNCQHPLDHQKSKSSRKTSTSASLTTLKPLTMWITANCGKFLKEMGISGHLTCLLRNLYASQEATVRTGHGTVDWFKTGKGVCLGCILSPCLFNLYAEYIILGQMQHKLESRLPREITSDMQMTPSFWQKSKEELKPLDESERGEWKSWLKTQHSGT